MNVTTHTFEICASTATRLLNEAGLTGVTVHLPTNLMRLQRLVYRTVERSAAEQINAALEASVSDVMAQQADMWLPVVALVDPENVDPTAVATAMANVMDAGPVGSRARGMFIGRVRALLDGMFVRADARGRGWSNWSGEGLQLLIRHEPERVAKLIDSLENGRTDDVTDALVEYVAERKRVANKQILAAQKVVADAGE